MSILNLFKNKQPKVVEKNAAVQDNGFPKKDNPLTKAGIATTDNKLPGITGETISVKMDKDSFANSNNLLDKSLENGNSNTLSNSAPPKSEKKTSKPPLAHITVRKAQEEGNLVIRIKQEDGPIFVLIHDYEFKFRKDFSHPDKPYVVLGNGNSVTVTEEELNYIFARFKNIN